MTRRYERITYRPEGSCRARTVVLRSPIERTAADGSRVMYGEEAAPDGSTTGRAHYLSVALIERRVPLTLDRHYGELVPVVSP